MQLHAIRGDDKKALATLREAIDAGWRADWRYYRDHEPGFARIRKTDEFEAMFRKVEADLAQQRKRLATRPKDAPPNLADNH